MQSAGRWTLLRSSLMPTPPAEERTEQWCRLLLRRYGVMFRDLLAGESAAPPWYELVRGYRRLEARGEIRGGRFVSGVAGEQYALPEAIHGLRAAGDGRDEHSIILPATDPLNFTGRLGGGPRVPALPGQFIVLAGGQVAAQQGPVNGRVRASGERAIP
jgi:ATP-dependent Lhr-like helicase